MEKTFSMIKPEAVLGGNAGKIMTAVEESGLKIVAQKMLRLSPEQAGSFYGRITVSSDPSCSLHRRSFPCRR